MTRRRTQRRKAERHDWLLLVPEDHDYVRFVSDLAGFDPCRYDGTVKALIPKVMSWLATRPDAVRTPTPQDVLKALPRFTAEKEKLKQQWVDGIPPWCYIVLAAITVCKSLCNRAIPVF
jgi:hypothetical protein